MITKYISNQFAKPSGIGGKIATLFMNIINQRMYHSCLKIISEYSNQKILDIGFGNGYMLHKISNATSNVLYGIDISEDMVILAQKKLKNKNIYLSTGSVLNIDIEENFFNIIYTINTFYFWENPEKALSEIFRTINSGGIFINFCYTKKFLDKIRYTKIGFNKLSNEEILSLHKNAGFESVKWIDIEKGKSFYILCKKK